MTTRNATLDGRLHDCPECGCSHVDFRKPPADVCADCAGTGAQHYNGNGDCPTCGGTGKADVCPDCDGRGHEKYDANHKSWMHREFGPADCPSCGGTGKADVCPDCKGRGTECGCQREDPPDDEFCPPCPSCGGTGDRLHKDD